MEARTRSLWSTQDRHTGDRLRLFRAVAGAIEATRVLYPGSYVDVAPSFVWPSVTYVDVDRRARQFFGDADGVREIVAEHEPPVADPEIRFLHADYREPLDLPDASVDLLISLYAGFVSESCSRYLRRGGVLLVNPSHGDTAMASLDEHYRLTGAILSRDGRYSVRAGELESYLQPKTPIELTRERLHELGRGVAYTRPAFAYLFTRVD